MSADRQSAFPETITKGECHGCQDYERPVPRDLMKTRDPMREEGTRREGYALIAAVLLIIVVVGYSFME